MDLGQEYEQYWRSCSVTACTYPSSCPGITSMVSHAMSEAREENNEGDRVENSDDEGVVVLQLEPTERERHVDGILQLEQVEKTPQQG